MPDHPSYSDQQARDRKLLAKLRRQLEKYQARPEPQRENYSAERHYRRAATIRLHGLNTLRRKIKTLEAGRPYGDWLCVQLEGQVEANKPAPSQADSQHMAALGKIGGARGGKSTSRVKQQAARRNGAQGGRPRKVKLQPA